MYLAAQKDPRGGHNRAQINHDFFKNWSAEMAYVLGFIYADGAIEDVQKSSRTCYIAITSKDLSIIEKMRDVMQSGHQIYKRQPKLQHFLDGKSYFSKEQFILRIGSKSMYNDLLSLGVTPRKSLIITFPTIPLNYFSHFIRGYFDGDGCLHLRKNKYPRVIFTSGSVNFLKGLAEKISSVLKIDIYSLSTQTSLNKNPCYKLYYSNANSRKILDFIYLELDKSPYLERKYKIYTDFLMRSP